jgi:hypothetical protein
MDKIIGRSLDLSMIVYAHPDRLLSPVAVSKAETHSPRAGMSAGIRPN